jgi:hypothetical protein
MFQRHGLGGLFAVLLGLLSSNATRADEIFVTNLGDGTIGAYTTAGATVNPALISGLSGPAFIAVVATVPEPSSLTLTLFGLVLAGLVFRAGGVNAPANLLSVRGRDPNRQRYVCPLPGWLQLRPTLTLPPPPPKGLNSLQNENAAVS